MSDHEFSLWSDDPAQVDLLSFDAVAHTVADALLDKALDPSGQAKESWESGRTTRLGLVAQELERRATELLDYARLRRNDTQSQESLL